MNDQDLIAALRRLGIEPAGFRAVALLPMIEVAWADGEIQPGEADLIVNAARERFALPPATLAIVRRWLDHRPSDAAFRDARAVLRALANRSGPLRLDVETLDDVITLCWQVARAAGGLFGLGVVDASEREVLETLAETLQLPPSSTWDLGAGFDDPDERSTSASASLPPLPDLAVRPHRGPADAPGATLSVADARSRFRLTFHDHELVLGRGAEVDLQIRKDDRVSRRHCTITWDGERYVVRDLDSKNGTFVDGTRCTEERLRSGQIIGLGAVALRFERL